MRRKEIVRYIVDTVNKKKSYEQNPITYRMVDDVLYAFRDCMVECICNGIEFVIPNMFQIIMDIKQVKGKRDPRTDKPIPKKDRVKCKVDFCYGFKDLLKHLEITDEMRKNIKAQNENRKK